MTTPDTGWIGTPALKRGGEGYDQFTIDTARISDKAVTRAKLSEAVVAELEVSDEDVVSALDALLVEVTQLREVVELLTA